MLISKFIQKIEQIIPGYTPSIILDIGSRDLDQSFEFRQAYPNSKVIAFEPNPEQTDTILNRKKLDSNIMFFPIGLGPKEGEMTLHIPYGGNHGASSLLEPIPSWAIDKGFYTKQVKVERLDKVLLEQNVSKVDIVWLDVQGYELSVLDGFGDYLKSVDFMHLEAAEIPYYKGHPDKEAVVNYLTTFGFDILHFELAPNHPNREGDLYVINRRLFNK